MAYIKTLKKKFFFGENKKFKKKRKCFHSLILFVPDSFGNLINALKKEIIGERVQAIQLQKKWFEKIDCASVSTERKNISLGYIYVILVVNLSGEYPAHLHSNYFSRSNGRSVWL